MKRYQECNYFEKFIRNRWYVIYFFKYIFYSYLKNILYYFLSNREKKFIFRNRELWKIYIGEAQMKMSYYYTSQEVKLMMEKRILKYKKK